MRARRQPRGELLRDEVVAFRPRKRALLVGIATGEVVHGRPRAGLTQRRTVVIARAVLHPPAQRGGIEAFARHPLQRGVPVERAYGGGLFGGGSTGAMRGEPTRVPVGAGHTEHAGVAPLAHTLLEPAELFAMRP